MKLLKACWGIRAIRSRIPRNDGGFPEDVIHASADLEMGRPCRDPSTVKEKDMNAILIECCWRSEVAASIPFHMVYNCFIWFILTFCSSSIRGCSRSSLRHPFAHLSNLVFVIDSITGPDRWPTIEVVSRQSDFGGSDCNS
jgi:hypothetical protein